MALKLQNKGAQMTLNLNNPDTILVFDPAIGLEP